MVGPVRRVVFYLRVSTEEQVERQSIQNQGDRLHAEFERTLDVELVGIYQENGISGSIPLHLRPEGRRLVADAELGLFDEVWVVRADRLGRDAEDMLHIWKLFKRTKVKLVGVDQSVESFLTFGLQALVAEDEKERILSRSAAGMDRAARNARYCGGIVALGYTVLGKKPDTRLVASSTIVWGDWTEAELVRRIYGWLALDNKSCRWIADELNRLGVPTVYQRDGRGVRGRRVQGKWRAGRIRNLVINPIYRGQLCYGRRSKRQREVITGHCEALVTPVVWNAAQDTLARNRSLGPNAKRVYMLRSKIVCGVCGLKFCGSWNQRDTWYRCNGKLTDRGPREGRCPSKMVKGAYLDSIVWADIERFLRNPVDLLDELAHEANGGATPAIAEAERTTLEAALASLRDERELTLDLYTKRHIGSEELDERMDGIKAQQAELKRRLAALKPVAPATADVLSIDLLDQVRARLDGGLNDALKQEIASLLVKQISVHPIIVNERKTVRIVIEYCFVVSVDADTGSWP